MMFIQSEDILKLLLAMALGGLIGMERELRDKSAGFRTLMFISGGSALFTIFSIRISELAGGAAANDPARIAAQIVTGIGFLGGGVILREHGEVRGLTTASTIWLVAALGIGAGAGQYLFSAVAAVLIFLSLLVFPSVEGLLGTITRTSNYVITSSAGSDKFERLKESIKKHHLKVISTKRSRRGADIIYKFQLVGHPDRHHAFISEVLDDPEITEFED